MDLLRQLYKLWLITDMLIMQYIGTAWYFLLELQLRLLFMERPKVEKMMKIYSEVSVFCYNLHYLLQRSMSDPPKHISMNITHARLTFHFLFMFNIADVESGKVVSSSVLQSSKMA